MTTRIRSALLRLLPVMVAAVAALALGVALLLVSALPASAVDEPTPTESASPTESATPSLAPTTGVLPYCDPEPTPTGSPTGVPADTATPVPTETPDAAPTESATPTPTPEPTCIPIGQSTQQDRTNRVVPTWPWYTFLTILGLGIAAWVVFAVTRRQRRTASLRRLAERA